MRIKQSVSNNAYDFLVKLLKKRPEDRLSSEEALEHVWLKNNSSITLRKNTLNGGEGSP